MKICKRCGKSKSIAEYRRTFIKKTGKYYLRSYCKNCLTKFNNERRKDSTTLHERENTRKRLYYYRHKLKDITSTK